MTEKEFNSRILPLYSFLYGYAFAILRNESEASDCLQDAFCRLWEIRDRLGRISNYKGYCIIIVKRMAIDFLRKRDSTGFVEELHENIADELNPTPDRNLDNSETLSVIDEIFDKMPERQREIVRLSAVGGLSNPEIEKITGLSGDNVRVLLSRGRKKFKLLFDNHFKS